MKHHLLSPLKMLLVSSPFLYIAFLPYSTQAAELYGIYSYISHQLDILTSHPWLLIGGLMALTVVFLRSQHISTRDVWYKKYFLAPIEATAVASVGLILSYVFVLALAWIELNALSLLININPGLVGASTDRAEIIKKLETYGKPPAIITSGVEQKSTVAAIAVASSGKSSYFGGYILPSIPLQIVMPVKKLSSSVVLIDNSLIISEINPMDMQSIGPVIGYLFVKQYFSQRPIKAYPEVSILGKEEYALFRRADAIQKLARVDAAITDLYSAAASTEAEMQTSDTSISQLESQIQQVQSDRDTQYKQCIAAGSYQGGKFVREFTAEQCKEQRSNAQERVTTLQKQIEEQKTGIKASEQELADYEFYRTFLVSQRAVVQTQAAHIPNELGMFDPGDSIKLVLNSTDSHTVADYLATLTHEYLHYASFKSPEQSLYSSFFEEGLTEYFARRAIQDSLGTRTNLSYSVQVRMIEEMTRRIPEVDFADIYFSKDEAMLKTILDRVYGEGFYAKTLINFEKIQYTSDPAQALALANEIMKLIDGPSLTLDDLKSSSSSL